MGFDLGTRARWLLKSGLSGMTTGNRPRFTFSLWLYSTAIANADYWFSCDYRIDGSQAYHLWHASAAADGHRARFGRNSTFGSMNTNWPTLNAWHHFLWRSGDGMGGGGSGDYVPARRGFDGAWIDTDTNSNLGIYNDWAPVAWTVGLGRYFENTVYGAAGGIAELAIWKTDLSNANCDLLAGGAIASDVDAENLVGYWPLRTDLADATSTQGNLTSSSGTFVVTATHPIVLVNPVAIQTNVAQASHMASAAIRRRFVSMSVPATSQVLASPTRVRAAPTAFHATSALAATPALVLRPRARVETVVQVSAAGEPIRPTSDSILEAVMAMLLDDPAVAGVTGGRIHYEFRPAAGVNAFLTLDLVDTTYPFHDAQGNTDHATGMVRVNAFAASPLAAHRLARQVYDVLHANRAGGTWGNVDVAWLRPDAIRPIPLQVAEGQPRPKLHGALVDCRFMQRVAALQTPSS